MFVSVYCYNCYHCNNLGGGGGSGTGEKAISVNFTLACTLCRAMALQCHF